MLNILITQHIPLAKEELEKAGHFVVEHISDTVLTHEELISLVSQHEFDIIIPMLTDRIDESVILACPTVKLIACYNAGYDHIDLDATEKYGIIVTHTKGNYSRLIAEYTLGLILSLTTRINEGDRFMRKGLYRGWSPSLLIGDDISTLTLGIIGAGNIGSHLAQICYNGLKIPIRYFDKKRNIELERLTNAVYCDSLDNLLKTSDIVSLHVPLLPSTHHLISTHEFNNMKPFSYLINTSRGSVVDEEALIHALSTKKIKGAGLDVFEYEPHISEALFSFEHVILTPHIASARQKAREEMSLSTLESINAFVHGKELVNKVNTF